MPSANQPNSFVVRGLYFALVIFDRVKRAPDSDLDSFRWDLLCNKNFQAEDQSDMQVIELMRERYFELEEQIAFHCEVKFFGLAYIDKAQTSWLSPSIVKALIEANSTQHGDEIGASWFTDLAAGFLETPPIRQYQVRYAVYEP